MGTLLFLWLKYFGVEIYVNAACCNTKKKGILGTPFKANLSTDSQLQINNE